MFLHLGGGRHRTSPAWSLWRLPTRCRRARVQYLIALWIGWECDTRDCIKRRGNRNGKDTCFSRVKCFAPLTIPFSVVGKRTGFTFEGCDAAFNGRFSKREMGNCGVAISEGHPRNCHVHHSADFRKRLDAKDCEPGIGLFPHWIEGPNLARSELGGLNCLRRVHCVSPACRKRNNDRQTSGDNRLDWGHPIAHAQLDKMSDPRI